MKMETQNIAVDASEAQKGVTTYFSINLSIHRSLSASFCSCMNSPGLGSSGSKGGKVWDPGFSGCKAHGRHTEEELQLILEVGVGYELPRKLLAEKHTK